MLFTDQWQERIFVLINPFSYSHADDLIRVIEKAEQIDRDTGRTDLYISFRQENGSWGPAINMGEDINTEYEDAYGSVTPDGKYFFFHTVDLSVEEAVANIFWVDAQVIENLRQK